MRSPFPDAVEKGRVRDGPMASEPGQRGGAFFIRCPKTGERLKIIANSGQDWTVCQLPGEVWEHVSVSCERRCPIWDEMIYVKEQFFEDEELVIQFHPQRSKYVNQHPFVLHLWRPTQSTIPMPPAACV